MQGPTLTDIRVRNTSDSQIIFEAVARRVLPLITRRLTSIERRDFIQPGSVFVWEERGPESGSSGPGIERWTDGKQWEPSRVRDEFLIYNERVSDDGVGSPQDRLIKQTYSVWAPTPRETKKWHLVAYLTGRSMGWLGTIDCIPKLARLKGLPRWLFRPARTTKGKNYGEDALHVHIVMQTASHGNQHHKHRQHHESPESWASPGSNSSVDEYLPKIGYVVPSAPWRRPTSDERLGVEFPEPRQTARTLAPLIYLQSISAPPRQPLDDFAIRAFDSHGV
ncbi:hypothetical protein BDM02DRAFT_1138394 [Thelephora ganbajun]|uniref:Uncharacterized protein n=1 Tax=Thelephora ganbajun TaxID=370292 RepID=A0ACB6ZX36_THEGA|nr:hypothetical protein BDM02DRAFT_1138394 [Thelephora ganbajun]